MSSHVEAMQTMVDHMKATLEGAQANLFITQDPARSYGDRSRREETYKVGKDVVLSMHTIHVSQNLPANL